MPCVLYVHNVSLTVKHGGTLPFAFNVGYEGLFDQVLYVCVYLLSLVCLCVHFGTGIVAVMYVYVYVYVYCR